MTNKAWIRLLPSQLRSMVEGRSNLQSIIANTMWLVLDKIVRLGIGMLVSVWIARYLGPEQFGMLNFSIAFVALFSMLLLQGMDVIIIRDIVRDPSCAGVVLGSTTLLKLAGSLLTVIFSLAAIIVLHPSEPVLIGLVALNAASMLFLPLDTIDCWFQSQVKAKLTVYARNIAFFVIALVKIAMLVLKAPLVAFAAAAFGETLLGGAALVYFYRRDGNSFHAWKVVGSRAKSMFKESCPLILQGIIITIYMKIDQVMLGQLHGLRSVGEFSAATRIVEIWYFIPMVITASLFPEIIKSRELGPERYENRILSLYSLMVWMSFCVAVVITFSAPFIIKILYGSEYQNSATVLSIQTWMAMSVFFGVARGKWLAAEGHLKDGLYVDVAIVIINVCANILLIPRYGAVGAATASIIAAFGGNVVVPAYPGR